MLQKNPRRKVPGLAERLLNKIADRSEKAAILGDFAEEYNEKAATRGIIYARFWYWRLVFISFPSFLKNLIYGSGAMLKNYLKAALRNLSRHKFFSVINISGLAIGMACSLLITVFVFHELSFDQHHQNKERIYRVGAQFGPTPDERGAFTSAPMAKALKAEFPEIEYAARISPWPRNYLLSYEDKRFLEKGIIYADNDIFNIFSIPLMVGDPKTALSDPNKVVITQDIAQKYFGTANPVGKSLRFDDQKRDYLVTGVIENCPSNSHFQFEMIASLISTSGSRRTTWRSHSYFTYILVQDGSSAIGVQDKFPAIVEKYWGAQYYAETGQSFADYIKDGNNYFGFFLQPLLDIHMDQVVLDNISIKGNPVYVYVFGSIAVFILLIAIINFMNLSTARFAQRSREVGVRKVLGSSQKQLVLQFLGESILCCLIALGLALLIVQLALPFFSGLAERQLEIKYFSSVFLVPLLLGFAVLVGLLAGSYPAFFLSSFQPVRTIKGSADKGGRSHLILRRGLVVLQFSISLIILMGTFVIFRQMQYVSNIPLGFDQEQVVVIPRTYTLGRQGEAFKQELLRIPQVLTVSHSESLPGRHFDPNGHKLEGRPVTEEYTIFTTYVDNDFAQLLDLEMADGRFFSAENPTDVDSAVVINETAARDLGIVDPVGKRFHKEFRGGKSGDFVSIIGVIKDIHFQSLHNEILPMIFRPMTSREWFLTSVRVSPENIPAAIARIEDIWSNFTGGKPFEFSFLDDDFNKLYRSEQKSGQLTAGFSLLAIFIACLGLLGLVSFTAEQRTKEIGIRKILGASVFNIFSLLSREVVILVLISALIAAPVGYYAMKKWLQNFAFRIGLEPGIFFFTTLLILMIALLSVSFRAIRAARSDPADSLRYE